MSDEHDKHLISPHRITPESNIKNKRIKNDHKLKKLLIITEILSVNSIGNVQEGV